ncbi:carboxylesterase family protein [Corynebacterium sp. 3HC-13]|uniref:carboxylesterase family protein n=1 Tax=Corynebacterium poyangense TaxID=2684405 RepID=UPI001CCBA787|nr:carboxylesterase family protein [Corynebacterium poyangense]MBZ8178417.1 carboxylesterase family protein [Corynebacterium poyangense]
MKQVTVSCPQGHIQGIEYHEGIRVFHSIPHLDIPGPFYDSQLRLHTQRLSQPVFDCTSAHPEQPALSIVTPAHLRPGSDAPVIAYIHGGAYIHGSHADPESDAVRLAQQGYVCVNLGYRLGAAGFSQFHDDFFSHYRGINDCLLGLEWIQRCIESFGGDPTSVTLMGQSAGGGIVLWLMRRDQFRGGFRQAIALSPSFPRVPGWKRRTSLRSALFCPLTRSHLNDLATRKPRAFTRGQQRYARLHPTDVPFGPFPCDSQEWDPSIPVLLSCTDAEFWDYPFAQRVDPSPWSSPIATMMLRHFGVPASQRQPYFSQLPAEHRVGTVISDAIIRRWVAECAASSPSPTWVMQHRSQPDIGKVATHCADLDWIFHATSPNWIRRTLDYFIHHHELNWPRYEHQGSRTVVEIFGSGTDSAEKMLTHDPLAHIREAFPPTR